MKKHFLLFVAFMAIVFCSIAQSRIYLPLMIKNNDGSTETYNIKKGDKLVYAVDAFGSKYDFIVTVNNQSPKKGIDFNYEMTNDKNTKGHVKISGEAKRKATKYVNYFGGGNLNMVDACTVWLSDKNFADMPLKKTIMQMDKNSPETFYLPIENEVNPVVKIKGENKKLDGFIINNAADGKGNKTLWINNVSSNSLILKMELGFSIQLVEIK